MWAPPVRASSPRNASVDGDIAPRWSNASGYFDPDVVWLASRHCTIRGSENGGWISLGRYCGMMFQSLAHSTVKT